MPTLLPPKGNITGRKPVPHRASWKGVAFLSVPLAVIALLPCAMSMGPWATLFPDSIATFNAARTLYETGGYPAERLIAPPGFPTVLAPLMAFGPMPLLSVRLLLSGCYAAVVVMTWLLFRREWGDRPAWLAAFLVATHAALFTLTTAVLSEMAYTAIVMGVLLMLARWQRRPPAGWVEAAFGGLLTAAAAFVRSMGMVLLPLTVLALLAQRADPLRRRLLRSAVFVACWAAPWVAWELRQSAYPAVAGYGHTWTIARDAEDTDATGLALQLERFTRMAPRRLSAVKAAVLPQRLGWRAFAPPWDAPSSWLVGGFFVLVALVRLLRYRSLIDAYVLLTLLLLSLWPWDEGVRLVAPLIPIFCAQTVWLALVCWRRTASRRWRRTGLAAVFTACLAVWAVEQVVAVSRLPRHRDKAARQVAAMEDLAGWLDEATPPDAPLFGVTPDRHNAKLIFAGAAYLMRRPVSYLDVRRGQAFALEHDDRTWVVLHASLAEGAGLPRGGGASWGRFGEWVLWKRQNAKTPKRQNAETLPADS